MPYLPKKIAVANNEKSYQILLNLGYSMRDAQRLIDRGRVLNSKGESVDKSSVLNGDVFLVEYECEPRGLKPIFENESFAVFDKPSGVLTHPNGRNTTYSMNDEIWHLFGRDASVAHRLDKETSGVLLVSKNRAVEKELKLKFENGEVKKTYLAMVGGVIKKEFEVVANLGLDKSATTLKNRIQVRDDGKFSKTMFKVVENYESLDATLVECIPTTGRQHQIRVHLFHVKHPIIGDTMYGVSDKFAEEFLDDKVSEKSRAEITRAKRLLLHSQSLEFEFNGEIYKIESKFDARSGFLNLVLK
ncbi:MAG: RluA family pseudouridine synthase [Campylobacteraceae bacterium]|nr:RluA family pseudouridine synthase [Campylobacteraceae bacterium]